METKPYSSASGLTLGEKFGWLAAVADQLLDPTIFDQRSLSGFSRANIRTWGDLASHTNTSLLEIPHMGEITVAYINRTLATHGASMTRNSGPNTECSLPDSERKSLAAEFEPDLRIAIEWTSVLTDDTTLEGLIRACLDQDKIPEQVEDAVKNVLRVPSSHLLEYEVAPLTECIADLVSKVSDPNLLASCGFGRSRAPWRVLGGERGITGEAVRRKFARDSLLIRGLLASDRFRTVRWATKRLQADFGAFVPNDSPIVEHWRTRLGEHNFEALRWLANYVYDGDGWLRSPIAKISDIVQKFDQAIGNSWLIRAEDLENLVVELEHPVHPETSLRLLRDTGSWCDIGDGWLIRWDGTIQDKAARVLELVGRPMTPAELIAAIGYGSEGSLKNKLGSLIRIDKQFRLALPEWGYEEYEGIVTEIKQRIQRGGGVASCAAIIDEFTQNFGIRVSSISTYLKLPIFEVDGDSVRLASSPKFAPKPPSTITGAIQTVIGWGERHTVSALTMQGYSFKLDPHIAWDNGIRPGDSLRVPINGSASHEASIIWRTTSLSGDVEIGRVRSWLEDQAIGPGEDLLLCPTPDGVTIYVGETQIASARDALEAKAPPIHPDIAALMEDL